MEEGDAPRWMDMPFHCGIAARTNRPCPAVSRFRRFVSRCPSTHDEWRGDHSSGGFARFSGIERLFDWVADGDVAIVELKRLIRREIEFANCIARLQELIEGDLGALWCKSVKIDWFYCPLSLLQ